MKLQRLLSQVRKAADDFHMIESGDRICVGLSGGKDSVTLLCALNALKDFYPHPFEIQAVSIDLGFGNMDFRSMEQFCHDRNIPYSVVKTQISQIVFEGHPEQNPCALCSRLRKGAFCHTAKELGCNKTAFGHHRDDAVNTMMLSLFFEGRFHTFEPVTRLDRSGLTLIRPLLYVKEADVRGFVHKYHLPVMKNACPADGATNREYVSSLLDQVNRDHPGVRNRLFTAVCSQLFQTPEL